jgi:hypothetical protein
VNERSSSELRAIFDADQTERREGVQPGTGDRDEQRLARVLKLIEDGSVRTAEDHIHAAMVLQHSPHMILRCERPSSAIQRGGGWRQRRMTAG